MKKYLIEDKLKISSHAGQKFSHCGSTGCTSRHNESRFEDPPETHRYYFACDVQRFSVGERGRSGHHDTEKIQSLRQLHV